MSLQIEDFIIYPVLNSFEGLIAQMHKRVFFKKLLQEIF